MIGGQTAASGNGFWCHGPCLYVTPLLISELEIENGLNPGATCLH